MFVRRNIPWSWTLYYCWPSLTYFFLLALCVYLCRDSLDEYGLLIPREPVTITATALAIFLGFKNSQAYDRWWEARKIWGFSVNFSRAWSRQILNLLTCEPHDQKELEEFQREVIYRHAAFVHAMRIFLRSTTSYPQEDSSNEGVSAKNDYKECRKFLAEDEYQRFISADNPPEYLIQRQGKALRIARNHGWLSEYGLMHLDQTLTEFNNLQGKAERIKKTPLPRPYSYFQRLLVIVLGTLIPFAFVSEMGWVMVPLSFIVSFVFLALDLIGSRTEDPFENRVDDIPMSAISQSIERNLREALGELELPKPLEPRHGVLL